MTLLLGCVAVSREPEGAGQEDKVVVASQSSRQEWQGASETRGHSSVSLHASSQEVSHTGHVLFGTHRG